MYGQNGTVVSLRYDDEDVFTVDRIVAQRQKVSSHTFMGGDHRQNSALDKRRCFRLRGGAFMRSVLDRGGPSGPYVVVLSERWWCFYTMFET